jgi:hypothetical protein
MPPLGLEYDHYELDDQGIVVRCSEGTRIVSHLHMVSANWGSTQLSA